MLKLSVIVLLIPMVIANPFLLQRRFLPWNIGRIVGGIPIGIDQAPYQISLQYHDFHICGGSIIDSTHILTACHCTQGNEAKDLKIRAGSELYMSGGTTIQVKAIHQHELYDPNSIDYDFSVLELESPLELSDKIKPIELPKPDEKIEDGVMCFVSGWGNTQSTESRDILRGAFVPSVNQDKCSEAYGMYGGITGRMVCAGYQKGQVDACQGDSGGPLVSTGKLIGVVSWGYGCAKPGYPGVYSRVASVRDWISEVSGV